METVTDYIRDHITRQEKMLVVLVDPDKGSNTLPFLCEQINSNPFVSMVFVGGSTGTTIVPTVKYLKKHLTRPIVLFPGNIQQFTPLTDALLFLTLLNTRDWKTLMSTQLTMAREVRLSGIETIPMGYVLIDGGRCSSVEKVTGCKPYNPITDKEQIIDVALWAELVGMQLIYLEAGSGALKPVPIDLIDTVKHLLRIPLIVGGGITSVETMTATFDAGADIVVIGNHFEQHPEELTLFRQPTR